MGKDLKGKELGQGLRQRSNGVYVARFVDRFGVRKELYDRNLNELRKRFLRAKYENDACLNVYDEQITVDEWFQQWMSAYKKQELRGSTYNGYLTCYKKHISPVIGDMRLSDVRPIHVRELLSRVVGSSSTKASVSKIVRGMYDKAIANDLAKVNPADGSYVSKESGSRQKRSLECWEQELFLQYTSGTIYYNLFVVAILTGMRIGELAALTEKDLNFEKGVISVNKNLTRFYDVSKREGVMHFGPPKTPTSIREVPMLDECEAALRRQLELKSVLAAKVYAEPMEGLEDVIFVTKDDKPLSNACIDGVIKTVTKRLNEMLPDDSQIERFSVHSFRHTFATRCFEAGIEPKVVQSILGHSSVNTTMDVYTHLSSDLVQSEMQKLKSVKL